MYYFFVPKTGRCYLHVACRCINLSAVQALLSQEGAETDVNARNVDGETPLLCMLKASTQAEPSMLLSALTRLLCDHGADISVCDQYGNDAVAVAEERGWTDVLNVLKLCRFLFFLFF